MRRLMIDDFRLQKEQKNMLPPKKNNNNKKNYVFMHFKKLDRVLYYWIESKM